MRFYHIKKLNGTYARLCHTEEMLCIFEVGSE